VRECDVRGAQELVKNGAALIDVREDNEYAAGHAQGARHMGRGVIERDIVQTFPDKDSELVLYCGGGYRSAVPEGTCCKRCAYTNARVNGRRLGILAGRRRSG
jgi:rhodanese-related sulfurtransferase